MMNELLDWLKKQKIVYEPIDEEVVSLPDFGKLFLADLSGTSSIFREKEGKLQFNLMEDPEVLMEEGIYYVTFPFGRNWYYYDVRDDFKLNILKYVGKRQKCEHDIPFVHLGAHTSFELLNSMGTPEQLCRKAAWLGLPALGICDKHTMAGTLGLQEECARHGIRHVFGYTLDMELNGEKVEVKVYCLRQTGLENLLRIQKEIMVDTEDNVMPYERLLFYAKGNVLILGKRSAPWMVRHRRHIDRLKQVFEQVYFQVDANEYKADRIDRELLESLRCYFNNFGDPVNFSFKVPPILITDSYYPDADDAVSKLLLNKIATGAAHEQSSEQYIKDADEHYATLCPLFSEKWNFDRLFSLMCRGTVEIAESAEARFETGQMFMPEYMMRPKEAKKYGNRLNMFRKLLEEGLESKIEASKQECYRERLEEETYIIESTDNVDYFLVQWDMVREAHRRGIVTGIGRGSAGGSLVSYLLGITSIDPIRYGLIFSRFLVPERCGLNWVDEITVTASDVELEKGETYMEVKLDGNYYRICRNAQIRIKRHEQEQTVYADELETGDEVLFDRRDLLWNLKELEIKEKI